MIKILLVDDHKVMRDGLRLLLEDQEDMVVVGEADHGREAVHMMGTMPVDLVVMDIAMPEMNGVEATRQIVASHPDVKVLVLSMFHDQKVLSEILKHGAAGFVVKGSATEDLVRAIRLVWSGETYLSPELEKSVGVGFVNQSRMATDSLTTVLTHREVEVLQLVAEGRTTKSIGLSLDISAKTVDTHRQNIMKKLNLRTVAELTKYAVREGITSLQF